MRRPGNSWWAAGHGRRVASILAISLFLATGLVVLTPSRANAAIPEVRTALPSAADVSGPLAVSGQKLVMGAHRSVDGGATWSSDAGLAAMPPEFWRGSTHATVFGLRFRDGARRAVYYSASDGVLREYTPPAPFWFMNAEGLITSDNVYLRVADGSQTPLVLPPQHAAGVAPQIVKLGPSGVVLWASFEGSQTYYALAGSAPATPSAWIPLPRFQTDNITGGTYQLTETYLAYVSETADGGAVYCTRRIADFLSDPTCTVLVSGFVINAAMVDFGEQQIVRVRDIWNERWFVTSSTGATEIQVPAGTSLEWVRPSPAYPPAASSDDPYLVARGTDTIPSVVKVTVNGTLATGFPLPRNAAPFTAHLALVENRILGLDTREGATKAYTSWSRSVSGTGFGAETLLRRAVRLEGSSSRTVVGGPDGMSIYDRGQLTYTAPDSRFDINSSGTPFIDVYGPYVRRNADTTPASTDVEIMKADGSPVGTYPGRGILFGSRYVVFTADADPLGVTHIVVNDLSGRESPRSLDLPSGSAACDSFWAWGDYAASACPELTVFSLVSGRQVATVSDPSGPTYLQAIGDGYAMTLTYTGSSWVYKVRNILDGAVVELTDCTGNVVTDGVGHIACTSSSELIWRDFSAWSRSSGRVLGWLAPATSSGGAWSPQIDVTKATSAGVLQIFQGATLIREIAVPAAPDGSVRGISWDGRSQSGALLPAGTYTAQLVVTGADGSGPVKAIDGTSAPTFTFDWKGPAPTTPGAFAPLAPARILDTRVSGGRFGASELRSIQVTGQGGVPDAGVAAVVLNITVTDTTAAGYLSVSPSGTPPPTVSNLNWGRGTTIPNAVTVKVGTGGKVDIYQSGPGTAHVIVDVAGYFVDGPVTDPGGFIALAPSRILDTRAVGGALAAGESRDLQVTGAGGVPATNVSAVVLNVTVTETSADGYLTVSPAGTGRPLASNLNWAAGATIPNLVVVKVGDAGKVSLYQSGPGSAQVIADVAGYYLGGTPDKPGMFVALAPSRVLDTRTSGAVLAGGDVSLSILGKGGVPASGVSAVVMNTTVTETRSGGFLTVYPSSVALPTASNLNWVTGTTIPNLVTVQTGAYGVVKLHNGSQGSTQVIADTAGFYLG